MIALLQLLSALRIFTTQLGDLLSKFSVGSVRHQLDSLVGLLRLLVSHRNTSDGVGNVTAGGHNVRLHA